MRGAKWAGGAVWAGSWYLMYLEITRWGHVKPSLAFNSDLVPEKWRPTAPGVAADPAVRRVRNVPAGSDGRVG
jgi:hypothetical protein